MNSYWKLIMAGGPWALAALLGVLICCALIVLWIKRRSKRIPEKSGKPKPTINRAGIASLVQKELGKFMTPEEVEAELGDQQPSKSEPILGTGNYKCMAVRPGNIIDFTTIPEPIGDLHQFDTSCPFSGGGYTVRELESGEVIDYDPREVPVTLDQTPEYAWFATHWSIVAQVFSVLRKWWQSTSTWFAAAVLVILFIAALVTLGG